MVHQLDNHHYRESELMEVKIPLSLPYMTSWNAYERFDGEVELNGIHYNYVERKIQDDTLYLRCLPNNSKTRLYQARTDYASKTGNIPGSNPVKEYNQPAVHSGMALLTVPDNPERYNFASRLTHQCIDKDYPPPQVSA